MIKVEHLNLSIHQDYISNTVAFLKYLTAHDSPNDYLRELV